MYERPSNIKTYICEPFSCQMVPVCWEDQDSDWWRTMIRELWERIKYASPFCPQSYFQLYDRQELPERPLGTAQVYNSPSPLLGQ